MPNNSREIRDPRETIQLLETLKFITRPPPCGHICSLQFTLARHEGLSAVSALEQGFFATKYCTASRLNA